MKPHPRIRKTIKWGGAVVTALLVVLWLLSAKVSMGYSTSNGADHAAVHMGQLRFTHVVPRMGVSMWWEDWWSPRQGAALRWGVEASDNPPDWERAYPLWPLALLTAMTTLIAWQRDAAASRSGGAGKCSRCNYDRTGLAAGMFCPECGSGGAPA